MEKKERLTSDKWPATGWAGFKALAFMISANPGGNSLVAMPPFGSTGKCPPCSGPFHSCHCSVFSCYLLPNGLLPDLTLVTPSLNGLFLYKKCEWSNLWWLWKDGFCEGISNLGGPLAGHSALCRQSQVLSGKGLDSCVSSIPHVLFLVL